LVFAFTFTFVAALNLISHVRVRATVTQNSLSVNERESKDRRAHMRHFLSHPHGGIWDVSKYREGSRSMDSTHIHTHTDTQETDMSKADSPAIHWRRVGISSRPHQERHKFTHALTHMDIDRIPPPHAYSATHSTPHTHTHTGPLPAFCLSL
jgi:hypothetical protein